MTAHFDGIRSVLIQELGLAKKRIQIAVAWFTDQKLFEILLDKAKNNVAVTVVIRNDVLNLGINAINWQRLIDTENGTVYFSEEKLALHHKFCIIDNEKLVTGSYNWTYQAQCNRENIICETSADSVKLFNNEFSHLLDYSRQAVNIEKELSDFPPASNNLLQEESSTEILFKNQSQVTSKTADSYEQLLLAANAAYCQMKYIDAEKLVHKSLKLNHKGVGAYSLLAGILWRTKRFSESVNLVQKAERMGLSQSELWNVCGLALEGLKRFKEAIAYYDRSIKIEPDLSTYYSNKCLALDNFGSERLADGVAYEAISVANAEIKKHKKGDNDYRLLQAYITCANVRKDRPEKRKYAQAASEVFYRIPVEDRDLHDLEDIKRNLK